MSFENSFYQNAAAKSLQSCPTLFDPTDGSPPGSPIPGILQARTLEWVAISFSNAWKRKVKGKSLSHVWPSATPWTAAFQAPSSMGFSRQECWSGVPLPCPNSQPYQTANSILYKACFYHSEREALLAQLVKNLPAMQETLVWFLGQEDPLEKG